MTISKRMKTIRETVDKTRPYEIIEAIDLLKSLPSPKFLESVELVVRLGVDPKKSDQMVRGAVVLPHGTGKSARVAVFTQGQNVELAQQAGADFVGMQDLFDDFQAGKIEVDVVIASPDAMGLVGRLGPVLGPKGLMPNPKVGTVTPDVAKAVQNAKSGQVRFRTDKNGIIHAAIGKLDFEGTALKENMVALLTTLKKLKPATSKGVYVKKVSISTTMGPGLLIQQASIEA